MHSAAFGTILANLVTALWPLWLVLGVIVVLVAGPGWLRILVALAVVGAAFFLLRGRRSARTLLVDLPRGAPLIVLSVFFLLVGLFSSGALAWATAAVGGLGLVVAWVRRAAVRRRWAAQRLRSAWVSVGDSAGYAAQLGLVSREGAEATLDEIIFTDYGVNLLISSPIGFPARRLSMPRRKSATSLARLRSLLSRCVVAPGCLCRWCRVMCSRRTLQPIGLLT
ncbi:hypothetical protein [Corynebacterium cystitidis]|uniref:Uncharacterized protein n=1 Tax=Corynebacterium cystitidis DSM 20524 TaxID=1121357 RepID=A0A1H9W3E3_9CORY|nr:hypothetical protein [Corynebacterium cystitidis]WJY83013.1 hypothetical protein CCYS_10520 [Corynebacterium cystitidis DSM 20524]SES28261.1 hypothetical protein SAMN05661109_02518 [Corynebacterium cystitidis DSM 20524]SNV64901.1 Uncharacterised protein [Corynebacterium cystitidis]